MTRPLLAGALAACLLPAAASAATIRVSDPEGARALTLRTGDTLVIESTSCTSCGFSWRTTTEPRRSVLRRTSRRLVTPPRERGTAGGSDRLVLTYRAGRPGSTMLRAGYYGPGRDRPTATYAFRVTVTR